MSSDFSTLNNINQTLITTTNGVNDDSAGGIIVSGSASTLYMYEGATVSNCKCSNKWGRGGAISVKAYGCMFMSGGDITGNESTYCAAAVYVHDNGSLTMSGGTISKNTARGSDRGAAAVEISESSKFTQTGGAITGNSPSDIVNKSTLQ
jgi:hypothetical protein